VVGLVSLLSVVGAGPARAAFPGRDGDLVVASSGGLELVSPATGAASSICTSVVLCGRPAQPHFSANGRAIAFVDTTSGRPVVIASDGSCLWCLLGTRLTALTGSELAFVAGSRVVTLAGNGLWSLSLTGIDDVGPPTSGAGRIRPLVSGVVGDAVWSSRGLVAFVRRGWVWVGRPGDRRFRRLARGGSPSWSPDGTRLVFARGGYVWVVAVGGGAVRRLVSGSAPAWSPDGRQIAFIGLGGAVEIIGVGGGPSRQVGSAQGMALDWQPLPASASRACTPPPGAKVLASSSEAIVYSVGSNAEEYGPHVYGCLKAVDRPQRLRNNGDAYFRHFVAVRLAGRFAAVEVEAGKPPGVGYSATLFDLSNGAAESLGPGAGGPAGPPMPCSTALPPLTGGAAWCLAGFGLDSVALDSSGFAAWRQTTTVLGPEPINAVSCPLPSLCIADDRSGDSLSSTNPAGGKAAWSMTSISPTYGPTVTQVTCPSTSLCLGLGFPSHVLDYTDPSSGTSGWAQSAIDPQNVLQTLSCPSVSLCVATDVGDVLTSTDPTGGPGAWTTTPIRQSGVGLFAYDMSCPSVSLCVATAPNGDILSSTNPTGGGKAWTTRPIDQVTLEAISCPSVSLCIAAGADGILTSTHPTGGAGAWTLTPIDPGSAITSISCPAVTLCVATRGGSILTSTDPTGGVGAWSQVSVDPGSAITSISCPSISQCVAGDQNGNVLTSTDPTAGANTWNIAAVDTPACASQPAGQCTYDQLYLLDYQGTRVVDSAPLGDGNLIDNVTLGGDSLALSWTHGGTQESAQLN
jgi:hypothetical protein